VKLSIEYRVQERNADHFSPGKEQRPGYLSDESGIMLVYDEDSQIAQAREEVAIVLFPLPAPAEQQIDLEFSSTLHQAIQLGYRCALDLDGRLIAEYLIALSSDDLEAMMVEVYMLRQSKRAGAKMWDLERRIIEQRAKKFNLPPPSDDNTPKQ
jgi:hypothetical protein